MKEERLNYGRSKEMMINDGKAENPAKVFLSRYRAMLQRRDSLQRAIESAYGRATSCTARIKAISVNGGNAAYDRMADDVAAAMDGTEQLRRVIKEIDGELSQIMRAIDAVPDEMQKTILTLRYIEGLAWDAVNDQLHIERTWSLKLHGRALWNIKMWMAENGRL